MQNEKYDTLIREVREISSDIARLDADLTKDRQDLADFKVKMARLAEEVKQSRKETSAITKDVGDKVKDTLKPAVKEVTALKDEISKKKTIVVTRGVLDWFRQRVNGGNEEATPKTSQAKKEKGGEK